MAPEGLLLSCQANVMREPEDLKAGLPAADASSMFPDVASEAQRLQRLEDVSSVFPHLVIRSASTPP